MRRRHPPPRRWLMTDERMGDALWRAVSRLPRGSGVVVRHHRLGATERAAVLARIEAIGRRRGLTVIAAGGLSASGGAHNARARRGIITRSAHSRRDIIAAERAGADLVFVSPVFATRSHPGARALGLIRFAMMTRGARIPVIALGGMTPQRWRAVAPLGTYGWAAIDAWLD